MAQHPYACPEHPDVISENHDCWCFKCEEIAERDRFQYEQLGISGPVHTAPKMQRVIPTADGGHRQAHLPADGERPEEERTSLMSPALIEVWSCAWALLHAVERSAGALVLGQAAKDLREALAASPARTPPDGTAPRGRGEVMTVWWLRPICWLRSHCWERVLASTQDNPPHAVCGRCTKERR